jgi:stage V sporulation protein AE
LHTLWQLKIENGELRMEILKAFAVGGAICVVGQLLIDLTKLTPARILVAFVVVGCILSGLGWYEHLVNFAGAGATIPLPGFGHLLATGVKKAIDERGVIGILAGGFTAMAAGVTAAMAAGYIAALFTNPKPKH